MGQARRAIRCWVNGGSGDLLSARYAPRSRWAGPRHPNIPRISVEAISGRLTGARDVVQAYDRPKGLKDTRA